MRYINNLTREEFFERARHGLETMERLATIEQFLEKKIPSSIINKMSEFFSDHKIVKCHNPKTGSPCLISGPEAFFGLMKEEFGEEKHFFVINDPKINLDALLGKFLITKQLGMPLVPENEKNRKISGFFWEE